MRVDASAKVNLYLHVVGRRDDGYHLLDSLVVFADFGDTLEFAPADELSLSIEGPMADRLPADANIVLEAARKLADRAGIRQGAAIRLVKRLPVAAGIGGGSADAAAALLGLSRLWGIDLPSDGMGALALELGADVPVCLAGRPARLSGIGEFLDEAPPLPPAWLVLANPLVPLSTPAVFKARTGPFSAPAPLERAPRDAAALAEELRLRGNDLTAAAVSLVPEVADALDLLGGRLGCLLARMSGSGATCFGLFAGEAEARDAAASLKAARPGWWVAAAALRR